MKQYLRFPDKLFRRVRDEHGNLVLSQAAREFHPGQGVYRSSFMNARRLAVTEANMAYRTADHLRVQQFDFVVGIEVHLSNNHNCKGVKKGEFYDICDELQGRYPKDFKFTGWHPHCRCYTTTILKTPEEFTADEERIKNGEPPSEESENEVAILPKGFIEWQISNAERAKQQYTMPYFIQDNPQYILDELKGAYGSRKPYRTYAEHEDVLRYNKKYATFSYEQQKNIRELNSLLPVMQGKIMNFGEADKGKCNPMFGKTDYDRLGYGHNCQTCTMAYELRRRGFNVEAAPNPVRKGYKKSREMDKFYKDKKTDWTKRFLNNDGTTAKYTWSTGVQGSVGVSKFIEAQTKIEGRYEVYCAWKKGGAHVFIVERNRKGKLVYFDPQTGKRNIALDYLPDVISDKVAIMRIDDKLINPVYASRFLKYRRAVSKRLRRLPSRR